ncbi:NUDIX domain-containing protein [Candidatus Gottesmanbacteria bacterium]|nr:NUDIX domain-containing protein [Candidatus Gottesmanbacteria bacterium]
MTTILKEERPLVGVGVMIIRNNKVLLGRRRRAHGENTYGWCGGHLEYGETLEECAKREVKEESGLEITSLKFLCLSNMIAYGKHYLDIEFLARVRKGEPKVLEPDKRENWGWYDLDKLPRPLFKVVKLAIKSYHTGQVYNP